MDIFQTISSSLIVFFLIKNFYYLTFNDLIEIGTISSIYFVKVSFENLWEELQWNMIDLLTYNGKIRLKMLCQAKVPAGCARQKKYLIGNKVLARHKSA